MVLLKSYIYWLKALDVHHLKTYKKRKPHAIIFYITKNYSMYYKNQHALNGKTIIRFVQSIRKRFIVQAIKIIMNRNKFQLFGIRLPV